MKLSDADKKQIIKNLIKTISHAANKEYQKRVWIEGRGPECEDLDDFLDIVLHENGAIIKKWENFNLTKKQLNLLENFQNELISFARGKSRNLPEEFIDTPEWKKIMNMAKEILKAFNYEKK